MLKQRVITALVLVAVLGYATASASAWPFVLVTLVLMAAGAWEWARLTGCGQAAALASGALCAALCALVLWGGWDREHLPRVWALGGAAWVLLGAWLLARGVPGWQSVPRWLRWLSGPLAMVLAWLAVLQARRIGVNFLFSVLVLVWAADTGAYFAGRALGGRWFARKLAPTISPGKTWEGALGGWCSVLLVSWAWMQFDASQAPDAPSLYSVLSARGWPLLVVAVSFMCTMSVVGDLLESLFKRAAGVKDSSRLLPGHGGVLDRVDALLPTLPLAMMLREWGIW